ncbi:acetoacetate decarboxylase family protein [Amycolatopsis rhizosphaerae]|uniref:acetoacetate decarboxylase family protein n=1 Tax=Amycolatopsis rhizosphaerae TaxID=2053003 RepID=UPI001643F898|nr:acetoacetate decarboxylase family protein [Amycolatopsis rhizosphaerae]
MPDFVIQGERVALPVEIRTATAASAMFLVRAAAVRSVLSYTGLRVFEPLPGRAICSLAFVRYVDGDLGPYHEFAVAYLIRPPDRGGYGVFIHWLPVNGGFTMEAGRKIWGFPKELAEIDLGFGGGHAQCTVRDGDNLVAGLRVRPGLRVPAGSTAAAIDAYTHRDGVLRRTQWSMNPSDVRARPGGAALTLGPHPAAEELRSIGLPKRPLFSSTIGLLRMSFGEAEEVR